MRHGFRWLSLVAPLLCTGGLARADGLSFDGDVPLFPHVDLQLSAAQKQQLAADARKGVRYPELRLTRAQQDALKEETGATVPWVFAVDRKTIGGEERPRATNFPSRRVDARGRSRRRSPRRAGVPPRRNRTFRDSSALQARDAARGRAECGCARH